MSSSTLRQRLSHPRCNHEARNSGQDADDYDRRRKPKQVGDDTGEHGDHRVARVAPEAVDANRAGPPGRMRYIADRRQECRIDESGTKAHEDRADKPPAERTGGGDEQYPQSLKPHARGDYPLTPQLVARPPSS